MRSLKLFMMVAKLILLIESAIAGFVFLAIAIAALIHPSFVKIVESFDCFSRAWMIAEYWMPSVSTYAVIVTASFLFGAFNTAIVLATCHKKR